MKKREQSPILLIILLLALLGASFIGIRQTIAVKNIRTEKERAENELDGVNRLKEELAWEVDSLQKAYLDLSAENRSLKESFEASEAKWAQKNRPGFEPGQKQCQHTNQQPARRNPGPPNL